MNWKDGLTALFKAASLMTLFGVVLLVAIASAAPKDTPPVKRFCRSLPTAVVGYGLSMHVVRDELYLCFQQGGAQGMTEIVCTPMKECSP